MKAVTWQGKGNVRVDDVPDPRVGEPTDAVIRVTSTAICGSDLHLPLDQAPDAYRMFQRKEDDAVKVVLRP